MPTSRTRSLVSLAAALVVALALGACVGAPARLASSEAAPLDGGALVVHFDNDARDYVHVYLVAQRRQWLLGRVEPGARATLRIPASALAGEEGSMQLAVLVGERVSMRAAREAHATITTAQPMTGVVAQRWTYSRSVGAGLLTGRALGLPRGQPGQR